MENKELTYSEAMAEIESILERMNEAEPDVDTLAKDVRRAGELISMCRSRLRKAESEIAAIFAADDSASAEQ